MRPTENAGRGWRRPAGAARRADCLSAELPDVPWRGSAGNGGRCAADVAAADPANNIVAGAPRFNAAAIRAVIGAGKGRMSALPHLTSVDVDNVVTFLTTARARTVERAAVDADAAAVPRAPEHRPS